MSRFRKRKPGRWRRRFRRGGFVALLILAGWIVGLVQFLQEIPDRPPTDTIQTEAIVVLTGGGERLEEGLRLLSQKRGQRLLISGANRDADLSALLASLALPAAVMPTADTVACCITVGYEAGNTKGNARETASWIGANNLASLRLVTANYHMPRSLLEFNRAMPAISIVPHPVFPEEVTRARWWLSPSGASLIVNEYHKYLLARLRSWIDRPPSTGTAAG